MPARYSSRERWVSDPWPAPPLVHDANPFFLKDGDHSHGIDQLSEMVIGRSSAHPMSEDRYNVPRGHQTARPSSSPSWYPAAPQMASRRSQPPTRRSLIQHRNPPTTPMFSLYDDPAFSSDPRNHPDFVMTPHEDIVAPPSPVAMQPATEGSPAFSFDEPFEPVIPDFALIQQQDSHPQFPGHAPDWQGGESGPPRKGRTNMRMRLAAPPTPLRVASDPLPVSSINVERPQPERRGNSSPPPNRPVDLDKIDELDESDPWGVAWHHGGRYEAIALAQAAQGNERPSVNQQVQETNPFRHGQKRSKKQVLEERPSNIPPPPIPYRLNLNPGEYLSGATKPVKHSPRPAATALLPLTTHSSTSVQPARQPPQTTHKPGAVRPALNVENAHLQPSPNHSPQPAEQRISPHPVQPPVQDNPPPRSRTPVPNQNGGTPGGSPSHPQDPPVPPPNTDLSQSTMTTADISIPYKSRSNVDARTRRDHPDGLLPESVGNQIRFEMRGSTSPGVHVPPGPPRSRPEGPRSGPHRPKRLVMPALLQPMQAAQDAQPIPLSGRQSSSSSAESVPTRATVIPIHESKMKNLLKKRVTIGSNPPQAAGQSVAHSATVPGIGMPVAFKTKVETEKGKNPESKYPRRLSKRRS